MPERMLSKRPIPMSTAINQAIWARLESLEHLSNQHDLLIMSLIDVMVEKPDSKPSTYTGTVEKST